MIVVGIDPALNSPGFAILVNGRLKTCSSVKVPGTYRRMPIGDRIQAVAALIADRIRDAVGMRGNDLLSNASLVYECPQIYGVGRSKADPNDLIALAEVGAAVAARLRPTSVLRPTPRDWTAGTSKNTDEPFNSSRWRRLSMILTAEESAMVPEQHDAIDALGLALHGTDRALAKPRRVYPGASPRRS